MIEITLLQIVGKLLRIEVLLRVRLYYFTNFKIP